MLTVVTFLWSTPGYRSKYTPEHVRTLRNMVARHYPDPHRFLCITDQAVEGVECYPIWDDHSQVPNPTWPDRGPSCYRRLKLFSPELAPVVGERFVMLDLDVVIVGDMRPLWNRAEACVTYSCPGLGGAINGAMLLATPARYAHVWDLFDPFRSPAETHRLGFKGSDQAWLNACLQHCSGKWHQADGLVDFAKMRRQRPRQYAVHAPARATPAPPPGTRIVFFHGKPDPWEVKDQWVLDNYR